jgi:hypothetical protein
MKLIKINESQKNRIFEAYQEGFSFEKLASIPFETNDPKAQYKYCFKWLGRPNGQGSSRTVFTLDDNLVLKLAYSVFYNTMNNETSVLEGAGADQNRAEFEVYEKMDTPLLPRILYHDDNFTFMVCESVLPATEEDFEKIIGLPYHHRYYQNSKQVRNILSPNSGDTIVGYNKYFDNIKAPYESSKICLIDIFEYIHGKFVDRDAYVDEELEQAIQSSTWLREFVQLAKKSNMSDYCQIENFGIVNRDGNPTLVILDSGLNRKVWEKHYK